MKERQFAGMMNSKSVYGQSYSDYSVFRHFKYTRIANLSSKYNRLQFKWYKKNKLAAPSWSLQLWNHCGDITYSQRMWNHGRVKKDKRIKLMKWRTK